MRRLVSNTSINKAETCSKLSVMWSDEHSLHFIRCAKILHNNLLTNSLPVWNLVLLEIPIASHLVKKFSPFNATRKFITCLDEPRTGPNPHFDVSSVQSSFKTHFNSIVSVDRSYSLF
jgi:hypothetical protein